MLLKTKGISHQIYEPVIGRVTRCHDGPGEILIAESSMPFSGLFRFDAVLTSQRLDGSADLPAVSNIPSFNHLQDGDIVVVNTDGVINTLYRTNSNHNFLLFTERCNSNCLMCSQPPKDRDDTSYYYELYCRLIPLIPKDCIELGITGGEPTLLGENYFRLLELLKSELPDTEIHCLTNGRSFAWMNMARRLARVDHLRLMLGIPLYSDDYRTHDYIVQARSAFHQTVQGFYNLAANGQRIELRVVLHKQSIPRLTRLAKYIYKNLPFVEHVAFMGLEHQGYTPHNIDKLWIDPVDYMNELGEAADYLSGFGIRVSIYNAQLCTMPEPLWKYARKSISDWKNIYLEECGKCSMIDACGGLFASGVGKHSEHIRAFTNSQTM